MLLRVVILVAAFAGGLFGQAASGSLTFDVASIKPSSPDARGMGLQLEPPNGMRVSNAPLRFLITFAYDIRDFQLAGGPAWIGTERYDIVAKAERTAESEKVPADPRKMTDGQRQKVTAEMRERVRNLLAERFRLTVRREVRDGPVYALVVAKGGSKMKEVQESDGQVGLRLERGQLNGMAAPMQQLTTVLSSQLGRPVIDKTELKGKYDFKLEWVPDTTLAGPPGDPSKGVEPAPPPDVEGPSIFSAIQEQLGLRLESQKGPVPTIVIERVERPTEN
ncbi:MAG TPA: TIGR03435 family protein [Bryobacteraceae bacterium]|nr:TIGR03435 family protein [Bryobacteraceae bacterium]